MPAIFGDHMVLQQSITLPVWGKADPGEKITVTVGPSTGSATAGNDGKWRVDLTPLKGSTTPVTMTVSGNNTLTFSDVLIGDVWACSGQSNMEFGINSTSWAKEDIAQANQPLIRLFIVNKFPSFQPQEDVAPNANPHWTLVGQWQVCTPDVLVGHGGWPDSFSAVAYFFGTEIQNKTKLPVGLIQCPWGGKPIQAFISLDALKKDPALVAYAEQHEKELADSPAIKAAAVAGKAEYAAQMKAWNEQYGAAFKQAMEEWNKAEAAANASHAPPPPRPKPAVPMPTPPPDGNPKPDTATHLYNGMIHPIIPFGIRGVIWYQGEANAAKPWDYDKLMSALISDWRARWGLGEFPFLYVQLANFQAPAKDPVERDGWPMLRDMQLRSLKIPNTGMAVAIDIGQANDIHPRNKRDVGHRLALAARRIAYAEEVEASGPIYDSMQVEGDKIRIHFKHAQGLKIGAQPQLFPDVPPVPAPAELPAFAIAGADQKWVPAKAVIDGETVVVSSDLVKQPVAVRYGWAKNPACHLYNAANLPASPFRTDDWESAPSPVSSAENTNKGAGDVVPIPVDQNALKKWQDDRFGMFIHWGPVSLTAQEISWSRGKPNGTPIEVYDNLYRKFNPEKFNADEWVAVAKAAGMKYIVLTAKHHDGFCLWDTKETDYNIMNSPFRRDVVKELAEACKKQGIKFGCYYSVPDGYHPDYPYNLTGRGHPKREKYDVDAYNKFLMAQTAELLRNYGPLVTVWYDTDGTVAEFYDKNRGQQVINNARSIQPDVLVDNRTGAPGDYSTPEQKVGGFDMKRPWESCMTISAHNHWAWGGDKDGAKPVDKVITTLVQCAGGDGNMLLNVGPRPDGVIDPVQVAALKGVGDWLKTSGESIYGTRGGPYMPTPRYTATRQGNVIYLHILKWDGDTAILPPLDAEIVSSSLLGGGKVAVDNAVTGLTIKVAPADQKPPDTIVKLELKSDAVAMEPIKPLPADVVLVNEPKKS